MCAKLLYRVSQNQLNTDFEGSEVKTQAIKPDFSKININFSCVCTSWWNRIQFGEVDKDK